MISRRFVRFHLLVFFFLTSWAHGAIPAAPFKCVAKAISAAGGTATVRIEWRDNSINETTWLVYQSINGGDFLLFETFGSSTTATTGSTPFVEWTAAAANTNYRFAIFAADGLELSAVSNIAAVGTFALNSPFNFSVTAVDPFNVVLSWEEGSTAETGFSLERKTGAGAWEILGEVSANQLSIGAINWIEPLESYSFRLRAYTGGAPTTPDSPAGATSVSAYSSAVSFTAGAYILTGAAVPGQSIISLAWPNVLNESGYRIYILLPSSENYQILDVVAANVTSCQVTAPVIEATETYSFIVTPINADGLMGESNEVTITVDGMTSKTGTSGTPGSPFSHLFSQISGSGSAVVSRGLTGVPAGLSFDGATGVLRGVYPALGNYGLNYSVTFANGGVLSQVFSIRVRPPAGAPVIGAPIPAWNGAAGSHRDTVLAGTFVDPEAESAVRVSTTLGDMDFILFDTATPATVANFMSYVVAGKFTDVAFHRSLPGFVIQGGGFKGVGTGSDFTSVVTAPPVVNEPGIANGRGTVSMAKVAGDPNSATSQFFVSLGDNRANLDFQNGGFTVFGRVAGNGMAVADAINGLPANTYNLRIDGSVNPSVFRDFPMNAATAPSLMDQTKLVKMNSVTSIPTIRYSITGNSNPAVASASINAGQLQLVGLAGGHATITVTATDLDNLTNLQAVEVTISDTYGTWASRNSFPGGEDGISGNPDGDALTNLQEYAFLGDPAASSHSPLPLAGMSGIYPAPRYLTLTFPVRKFTSGLAYMVEASDSLSGSWTGIWSSSDGSKHAQVAAALDQADRTVITIRDTVAITGQTKRFLRTRIVQE